MVKCLKISYKLDKSRFLLNLVRWMGSVDCDAMVFQFPEELDAQQTVQRHEKQEKQSYVVDLLT